MRKRLRESECEYSVQKYISRPVAPQSEPVHRHGIHSYTAGPGAAEQTSIVERIKSAALQAGDADRRRPCTSRTRCDGRGTHPDRC